MPLSLRPYQITALENIWKALQTELAVLLEAACSAGKTILFSKIIQRLLSENPSFRTLILTDREILINQSRDKLIKVAPELALDVGIVCASVSDTKHIHKRVTIASRQSLINRLNKFEPVHLTIVDECHLLAMNQEDQFGTILKRLWEYNSKMRLLGVTATPFRLSEGYIYGNRNAPGCKPYFADVHHRVTVRELEDLGYLAPLIGKVATSSGLAERLNYTSLVAGEYNLGQLSDIMNEGIHIKSAVEAWKEHASNRHKTIAFAVTIEHAEKLAKAFNEAGIPALAIHSELDDLESYANMKALKDSTAKVFTSVAKLTTGMDISDIDAILMARPTKSAALYKQILGRGQRIHPGKENCLVIDLVGNSSEFGTDLDKLHITYKVGNGENGKPSLKFCPQCNTELHPAVRICPDCGYEYPKEDFPEAEKPELKDVTYGASPPETLEVLQMYVGLHTAKDSKKTLLRVRLELDNGLSGVTGSIWLMFEGDGYSGFAVTKSEAMWKRLTFGLTPFPHTAEEAVAVYEAGHIFQPERATITYKGKWADIQSVDYGVLDGKPAEKVEEEELEDLPF